MRDITNIEDYNKMLGNMTKTAQCMLEGIKEQIKNEYRNNQDQYIIYSSVWERKSLFDLPSGFFLVKSQDAREQKLDLTVLSQAVRQGQSISADKVFLETDASFNQQTEQKIRGRVRTENEEYILYFRLVKDTE